MKTIENKTGGKPIYTLIPLEDFKSILSIDERDDPLCKFCLTTATFSIEQYCKRRLTVKGHFEDLSFWGEYTIPLTHYPVRKILVVYMREPGEKEMSIVEPDFYCCEPEAGKGFDLPTSLVLSRGLRIRRGERSLRVVYKSGYVTGQVPSDLTSACLELAAWNMSRYKGRRIGMTGSVRGQGNGEHLEMSMPENVRALLEPYRRKLI